EKGKLAEIRRGPYWEICAQKRLSINKAVYRQGALSALHESPLAGSGAGVCAPLKLSDNCLFCLRDIEKNEQSEKSVLKTKAMLRPCECGVNIFIHLAISSPNLSRLTAMRWI